ncbi:MAG: hypothetical protein ACLQJR_16375 [Stellaceae bacterium]
MFDSLTFISVKIMLAVKPVTKLAFFSVERVALFTPILRPHSHHGHREERSDQSEELPPTHSRLLPLNFDLPLTFRGALQLIYGGAVHPPVQLSNL